MPCQLRRCQVSFQWRCIASGDPVRYASRRFAAMRSYCSSVGRSLGRRGAAEHLGDVEQSQAFGAVGGGHAVVVPERGIGAMREQQPGNLHRHRCVVRRQPHERRLAAGNGARTLRLFARARCSTAPGCRSR